MQFGSLVVSDPWVGNYKLQTAKLPNGQRGLRGPDFAATSGVANQGPDALETLLADGEINNLITQRVEN